MTNEEKLNELLKQRGINPDEALTRANNRFMEDVQRWEHEK